MEDKNEYPNLEKLYTAIVFANAKITTENPQYEAIDRMTFDKQRIYIAGEYLKDIKRILQEIRYARYRINDVPESTDDSIVFGISPEEHLNFYEGRILELVYQLKEKICQLIYALITSGKFEELGKKVIKKLLKVPEIEDYPKIIEALDDWQEDGQFIRQINIRSGYVHKKNPLTRRLDFIDLQGYTTMLGNKFEGVLTDEGRRIIERQAQEKLSKLYTEAREQIDGVYSNLISHIEVIAQELLDNIPDLPVDEDMQKEIGANYQALRQRLRLKNETSMDNVSEECIAYFQALQGLNNISILAIYAVGSLLREGDFVSNLSDVRIIVVVKDGEDKDEIENMLNELNAVDIVTPIRIDILDSSQFQSDEGKFYRFICHVDGQLLIGKDQVDEATIPKPGLYLAELIAQQIRKDLPTMQRDFNRMKEGESYLHPLLSREIVKAILRTFYAIEVINNPQYTTSLHEILEILLESKQAKNMGKILKEGKDFLSGAQVLHPKSIEEFLDDLNGGKLNSILDQTLKTVEDIKRDDK